jgi:hypothetical protein
LIWISFMVKDGEKFFTYMFAFCISENCPIHLLIYSLDSFFFFFLVLRFELRAYIPWTTPPALFWDGFFWDRVSWTICPGWLWNLILLISAFWVIRITGVSHWCLATFVLLTFNFLSFYIVGI